MVGKLIENTHYLQLKPAVRIVVKIFTRVRAELSVSGRTIQQIVPAYESLKILQNSSDMILCI